VPESLIVPPELIFTTVPLVAPAREFPKQTSNCITYSLPNQLPIAMPCFVISAITDVSNESMEPNAARIMAYSIMIGYKEGSIFNIPSKCKGKGYFQLNSHLILKNKLLTMQQVQLMCLE
jgi:hypothetical protein